MVSWYNIFTLIWFWKNGTYLQGLQVIPGELASLQIIARHHKTKVMCHIYDVKPPIITKKSNWLLQQCTSNNPPPAKRSLGKRLVSNSRFYSSISISNRLSSFRSHDYHVSRIGGQCKLSRDLSRVPASLLYNSDPSCQMWNEKKALLRRCTGIPNKTFIYVTSDSLFASMRHQQNGTYLQGFQVIPF